MRKRKHQLVFLQISESILMKYRKLPGPVGLLKLMLGLLGMICIEERKLYFIAFMKIYH